MQPRIPRNLVAIPIGFPSFTWKLIGNPSHLATRLPASALFEQPASVFYFVCYGGSPCECVPSETYIGVHDYFLKQGSDVRGPADQVDS